MGNVLAHLSILSLVILFLVIVLRRWRQPYLIAYILAGIVLGPGIAGLFTPGQEPAVLGEFGIILLMFFLGLEIEIPDHATVLWRPVVGQFVKMSMALMVAWMAGAWLAWSWQNRLLLAVLLTFNSTAVVSEYMRRTGELDTSTGKLVLNTLLLQDVLVAPVFAFFQWMGRNATKWGTILSSVAVAIVLFYLLRAIRHRNIWSWSGWRVLEEDHDLQVFLAVSCCLGCSWMSSLAGLSAPIGSFAAGLWLGKTKGFGWLEGVLKPFKVFFVSLYFVSVGLSLDLHYVAGHCFAILAVTAAVLITNSLISAIAFRLLGMSWNDSWWAGALLSQTGELGLLACSMAAASGMIDTGLYKLAVAVTGLTLLLSTVWTSALRAMLRR